jgi:hypothetical protein
MLTEHVEKRWNERKSQKYEITKWELPLVGEKVFFWYPKMMAEQENQMTNVRGIVDREGGEWIASSKVHFGCASLLLVWSAGRGDTDRNAIKGCSHPYIPIKKEVKKVRQE